MPGLASIVTCLSHRHLVNVARSTDGAHSLFSPPSQLLWRFLSIIHWVIKPNSQQAHPANQCPDHSLPHTLQVFTYRTLFPLLRHTSYLPSHHSHFFQTTACAHLYLSSFLKAQHGIRALSLYSLCTLNKHSTWSLSEAVETIYLWGPVFSVLNHKHFKSETVTYPS